MIISLQAQYISLKKIFIQNTFGTKFYSNFFELKCRSLNDHKEIVTGIDFFRAAGMRKRYSN